MLSPIARRLPAVIAYRLKSVLRAQTKVYATNHLADKANLPLVNGVSDIDTENGVRVSELPGLNENRKTIPNGYARHAFHHMGSTTRGGALAC